jgi:2-polyprenyl-6-methoxyphenol hydroxylase-like FAD-dependent oxidoreductase
MKKEITIIGAGLVGSLLSIYLSKRGYKINIYERRPDMRKTAISAGRSINLALSDRGIRALEEVGIMDDIRKIAIPMHGRQLHHVDGSTAIPGLWQRRPVYQFGFKGRTQLQADGSCRKAQRKHSLQ